MSSKLRLGVAGPVGSGKTALVEALCRRLRDDLQLAVVAGSVALGFGDTFFSAAQNEIDRVADLQHSKGTIIAPAELGADGPLIGAAAVGLRGEGHDVGVR